MDQRESFPRIVKSVIADAGPGQRPALFFIHEVDENGRCEVHEQVADGNCSVWPESYSGRQQAEGAIYEREWNFFLSRPVRQYDAPASSVLENQFAELARLKCWVSRDEADGSMVAAHSSTAKPLRIIVVDDQEWIRTILVQVVLQTLPTAAVFETEDGLEALETFRRGGCDFLVTNHSMPGLNGPELIRQVRLEAAALPILMVSTNPEHRPEAMEAGASWFLIKPQIMEHLPKLLRQYARNDAKLDTKLEA